MRRIVLLIACCFAITSGAAHAQESDKDKAGIWLDVPFIGQTVEGCGSASIAMLLQYWSGHETKIAAEREDADAIQKHLYSRKGHGIYASARLLDRDFYGETGPFVDNGAIADSSGLFGSQKWLGDTGAQCKIRVLSSVTVMLIYGRDLRGAKDMFYGTALH